MKLTHLCWPLVLLCVQLGAAPTQSQGKYPSYSMMLMGGGLATCASTSESACSKPPKWPAQAKTANLYQLSQAHLANVSDATFWSSARQPQLEQVQALLKHLANKLADAVVTERELSRLWRSTDVEVAGNWISGRELFSQLTGAERDFIFDQLEILQTEKSNGKIRLKEYVSPATTADSFSLQLYQQFVELAREVSGNKTPTILVLTASGRDPFAAVDFYTALFNQLGAQSHWLPVNAAYQAVLQDQTANTSNCQQFAAVLARVQGSYARERVYPDLFAQQQEFCAQGHQQAVKMINDADAIFINGGNQSLTYQALKLPDGSDSPELAAIRKLLQNGEMVIGGTSAGTAVMSGGSYLGKASAMLTNGRSAEAFYQGALAQAAPLEGCENNQSCPIGVDENSLTYQANGGLGLFLWGVLDTHFSERGRQGRLLGLVSQTGGQFGFGVDETTALLVGFDARKPGQVHFAVTGASGVFVAEATANSVFIPAKKLQMQSHYFTNGDKFSLHNGQLQASFAEWKFAPNNVSRPLLQAGHLFQSDKYQQLAQLLCSTQTRVAHGRFTVAERDYQLTIHRAAGSASRTGLYQQGSVVKSYCSYRNMLVSVEIL